MLWCLGSYHKINNEINKSKNVLSCKVILKKILLLVLIPFLDTFKSFLLLVFVRQCKQSASIHGLILIISLKIILNTYYK